VTKRVDTDSRVVRTTMAGTRTVGRSIQTGRYIVDTPNRVLRDLNDRGQQQLRAYYRGIRGKDEETDLEAMTDCGQHTFKETLENEKLPDAGAQAAELLRRLGTDEFRVKNHLRHDRSPSNASSQPSIADWSAPVVLPRWRIW